MLMIQYFKRKFGSHTIMSRALSIKHSEHHQCSTVNDAVSLQKHGLFIKNSTVIVILRRLQFGIGDVLSW